MNRPALAVGLSAALGLAACAGTNDKVVAPTHAQPGAGFYDKIGLTENAAANVDPTTCQQVEGFPFTAQISRIEGAVTACLHKSLKNTDELQAGCDAIAPLNHNGGGFKVDTTDVMKGPKGDDAHTQAGISPSRFACVPQMDPVRKAAIENDPHSAYRSPLEEPTCNGEVQLMYVATDNGKIIPVVTCDTSSAFEEIDPKQKPLPCPVLPLNYETNGKWDVWMGTGEKASIGFLSRCE